MLHAVVRGEADASGTLSRVIVAGHAFGLDALLITVEGPRGQVEAAVGPHPRTHQWVVTFDDRGALDEAGIALGTRVRAVAADLGDPAGCYSTAEARVEAE